MVKNKLCKKCKKRLIDFQYKEEELCIICGTQKTLKDAGLNVPSLKSKKKLRYRVLNGKFDVIEVPKTGSKRYKHILRKKSSYFGTLDKECSKLTIDELEVFIEKNNKQMMDKMKEINRQQKKGEIIKEEAIDKKRELRCIQEVIRDWKTLKEKEKRGERI